MRGPPKGGLLLSRQVVGARLVYRHAISYARWRSGMQYCDLTRHRFGAGRAQAGFRHLPRVPCAAWMLPRWGH